MKVLRILACAASLTFLISTASPSLAQTGSTLEFSGDLYRGGRPQTGELGAVRDFAAWRDFLYVSWTDLDGDFWLDIWNISDLSAPVALDSISFGNTNDDAGALIPVAHLKAPRDMAVVDSHLVLWTALGVNIYPIQSNGLLGDVVRFAPQDRDDGVNRITVHGNYASTIKRRLSDQEVNALLNQAVPMQEIEALLNGVALINLQNPATPFVSLVNQNVGANILSLSSNPVGTVSGSPVLAELSDDNTHLNVTLLTQERAQHFSSFWDSKFRKVFRPGNFSSSLDAISRKIAGRKLVKGEIEPLLRVLKKGVRAKDALQLQVAIKKRYSASASLRGALGDFSVDGADSIELMLRKIAEKLITQKVSARAAKVLLKKFGSKWYGTLFALNDLTPVKLSAAVAAAMNGEIENQGLSKYLVRKVLAPLVDIPPELLLTLGDLIDQIASSDVAGAIDGFLETYHTVFPVSGLLSLVGFEPPQCFDIPHTSKGLLELLLIDSGPQLDRSELALFELLKLVQYYLGTSDLDGFVADLRRSVKAFHVDLSNEVVSRLFRPFAGVGEFSGKISKAIQNAAIDIDLRPVLADILAQGIVRQLKVKGVDTDISVEAFFDARADAGRGEEFDFATIEDLLLALSDLKLSKLKIGQLYARAIKAGVGPLADALRGGATHLLREVLGAQSADATLADALQGFVQNEMNPKLFGDFVDATLGRILTERKSGTSLPDLLGIEALKDGGDCVSQWRFAILLAEGTAFTLQLDPIGIALGNVEEALQDALDSAIGYMLRSLIQEFVSGVFDTRAQSYESWYTNIVPVVTSIDLGVRGLPETRFGTPAAFGNRVAVLLRNSGASIPTPELSQALHLVRFDPTDVDGSFETLTLGDFTLVNSVLSAGDRLLIVGNEASSSFFGASAAKLVQFEGQEVRVDELHGDDASLLSASSKMLQVRNNGSLGVLSGGGYIVFIH